MNTKDTCGSEKSSIAGSHKSSVEKTNKKKRTATCSLCKNHNLIELYTEGHKTNCPGQYCMCSKCDQKRKHQKQTAAETRKSRAKKNERLIQERQRQKENSLVSSSLFFCSIRFNYGNFVYNRCSCKILISTYMKIIEVLGG